MSNTEKRIKELEAENDGNIDFGNFMAENSRTANMAFDTLLEKVPSGIIRDLLAELCKMKMEKLALETAKSRPAML